MSSINHERVNLEMKIKVLINYLKFLYPMASLQFDVRTAGSSDHAKMQSIERFLLEQERTYPLTKPCMPDILDHLNSLERSEQHKFLLGNWDDSPVKDGD